MAFNKVAYFRNLAIVSVDINHTDESPRFFRASGTGNFFEMLESGLNTTGRVLIIDESEHGRLIDNKSDNLLDNMPITFWVMENHSAGDFNARELVKKNCKATVKKILARMFRDQSLEHRRADNATGLRNIERGSVIYTTTTSMGDNYSGIMVTFNLVEQASILFDTDDWTDE